MPTEKWRHHERVTLIRTRVCQSGRLAASITVEDLFVPEGFEKGDPQVRGVIDPIEYKRLNNRVAVGDYVMWMIGEQQKGIDPKEVEDR